MSDLDTPARSRDLGYPTGGQPLAITRVVGRDTNGAPITAGTRFLQMIAMGWLPALAATAAGMSEHTAARLLKQGATIGYYVEGGRRTEPGLTPKERELLAFSREYDQALATGTTRILALAQQAMQGGGHVTTTTTTTKRLPDGVEETTTTVRDEVLAPSEQMIRWALERRFPQTMGAKLDLTIRPILPDRLEPDEDDRLAFAAAVAEDLLANAIDVTETETDPET